MIVPELCRLAADLRLIRDLGELEEQLIDRREFYIALLEEPGGPIAKWSDEDLVSQTLLNLAHLQGVMEACRRRGLLG